MRDPSHNIDNNNKQGPHHSNRVPSDTERRNGRLPFPVHLRSVPSTIARAANDNGAVRYLKLVKPTFDRVSAPIQRHADYVFPLSCISGALCVKFAGHVNDDPLMALGGTLAAGSNSFLFASKLLSRHQVGDKLGQAFKAVKGAGSDAVRRGAQAVGSRITPATVSMSGLVGAGALYIGSGVDVNGIVENWGSAEAFQDAISNMNFSNIALGTGVGGAALCKLRAAHEWSSRLATAVPATLAVSAISDYMANNELNVPVAAASILYGIGAYAVQFLGKKPSSPALQPNDPSAP